MALQIAGSAMKPDLKILPYYRISQNIFKQLIGHGVFTKKFPG
jgi:hypothetical protein